MSHSVKNNMCSFRHQMSVVLRTYLTRWEFYVVFLLGAVVSIGCLLITSLNQNARSRGPETSHLQDKYDYLFALLIPVMCVGPWLGMHLKQQFAAPRSRLVPGFAKAHLAMAACLMALLISLNLVSVWMSGVVALASILAIQIAACAWMLWMAHLNSTLMILMSLGLFFGVRHLEDSATQALFFDWFLARSITIPSFLLLTAGVAGLWAYACRLARCHEAMPEYGTAISMDAAWDFTSRSANRSRQQMEATVISKSVVNAWLLDRQFEFVMRYLPKHWLTRGVILLQVSHGLPILRLTLVVLLIVLVIGGVSVVRPDGSNNFISFAVTGMTASLPCIFIALVHALWKRHWQWYSAELLRPLSRQRYVASVLTAIAADGLGGLLLAACPDSCCVA
ncbi:MAG: hypothetical protein HQ518_03205 [Rhodopirellula sp.]|nr:hypothetical protein [Rhodopirellula sp.]